MDVLIARLGAQAMNMAIRSGITITSAYAIQQYSRLVASVDTDKKTIAELRSLQQLLSAKIKILSPTLDLIEFKSGRGNALLQATADLTKSLHRDIVGLGRRLEGLVADSAETGVEDGASKPVGGNNAATPELRQKRLRAVIDEIKRLLDRIDRDIPMLQLAITASGESMSTTLPPGISPSRLLQASAFLMMGDTQFASLAASRPGSGPGPVPVVQIGPAFCLSLYMLFVGHADPPHHFQKHNPGLVNSPPPVILGDPDTRPYGFGDEDRKPIWKEVIHKAQVRLCRVPTGYVFDSQRGYCIQDHVGEQHPYHHSHHNNDSRFAYFLEIIENLDDGRAHDNDNATATGQSQSFLGVAHAGIREALPVHQISKIFYTDTGRMLNLGSTAADEDCDASPVLLLKRDLNAPPPKDRSDVSAVVPHADARPRPGQIEGEEDDEDDEDDLEIALERQLQAESEHAAAVSQHIVHAAQPQTQPFKPSWDLPANLDQEWLAFEVHVVDQGGGGGDDDDDSDNDDEEYYNAEDAGGGGGTDYEGQLAGGRGVNSIVGSRPASPMTPTHPPQRAMASTRVINAETGGQTQQTQQLHPIDSGLIEQIRNISLMSPPQANKVMSATGVGGAEPDSASVSAAALHQPSRRRLPSNNGREVTPTAPAVMSSAAAFAARSPFGMITSSLSLLEMLVRLTSLQEFQQTSHLAIPDHVLIFFLEETSTTGLRGPDRWRARSDAEKKVGFDPYTDSPAR